jgi:hypothetical protein
MGLLRNARRLFARVAGREYAIRFRLLRSSLSPSSIRAERRADVLLVSYPKCGRTWLTMLLARALSSHAGLGEVDYLANDLPGGGLAGMPRIRISHDDNPHWKTPRTLARSKRRYRRKKVILLVRDPRDVVVSMYFERSRRERAYSGTMHEFLHESKGSLDTIIAYYNVWARERAQPRGFCLVRYEDLKRDPAGEARRILRFVGLEATDAHVDEAARFASFENMRAMEAGDVLKSGRLRARDPNDAESFKTRKAKVGGYVDYLGPEEIAWMERRIRETLDPLFGYGEPARSRAAAEKAAAAPVESRGVEA